MHAPLLGLSALALVAAAAVPATAQTMSKPSAPAAKPDDRGVKMLEAGLKAYDGKKLDQAVTNLSGALTAGGLTSQQMAKALFIRGSAYRRQGKAAQAISDLTSAVWLKGGLADSDKVAAIEERAAAYREAGLGEPSPIGSASLDQAPAASVAAAPPAPGAGTTNEAATSSWQPATSEQSAAAASTPVVPSAGPVSTGFGLAPPADTSLSALPGQSSEAQPAAAPSLGGVGTAISNAGTSISGFFGNMFGGGQQATVQGSAPVQTATATAEAPASASASGWGAETNSAASQNAWATTSSATSPSVAPNVKVASREPASAAAAPAAGVALHLAAVRSREEAERMAKAVTTALPNAVGNGTPSIDEVVYGNMGKFYRVRLGPYASANEANERCQSLKPHGYDCIIAK